MPVDGTVRLQAAPFVPTLFASITVTPPGPSTDTFEPQHVDAPVLTLAAAIRMADADGLPATSMARLAAALGVGTMTLYSYVPSRAELIDLKRNPKLNIAAFGEDPEGELFILAFDGRIHKLVPRTPKGG